MAVQLFSQASPSITFAFHTVGKIRRSLRGVPTSHPVEEGVDVTDHIQRQAEQLFLSGARVSESPYTNHQAPFTPEVVVSALERMLALGVVTVVTPLGTYRDMAIASMDYDKTNKAELIFELAFQNIRFATPVSVLIPVRTPVVAAQVGFPDTTDAGAQPPVDPTAPVDWSFLKTAKEFSTGLAG